ncbi:hypothetical protein AX14_002290 [Amanita brunnescens Koide BX004]|jgi:hypothetical protein|nr:hypothetical protein AX14_002290 [Amanita brunnescens Koide BX004]
MPQGSRLWLLLQLPLLLLLPRTQLLTLSKQIFPLLHPSLTSPELPVLAPPKAAMALKKSFEQAAKAMTSLPTAKFSTKTSELCTLPTVPSYNPMSFNNGPFKGR